MRLFPSSSCSTTHGRALGVPGAGIVGWGTLPRDPPMGYGWGMEPGTQ